LLSKQKTGRLDCASCRCGYWGATRTCALFDRALGKLLVAGLSNRPGSLLTNPGRELSAAFLAGLVQNLGEVLLDRLARFRRELLGKPPQLLVLGGCGVEGLARLRHRQGDDIRD
jgi:hypothetical protein